MGPKISIIIPCYNSENTLEETLISVKNQVFQNWEAIIVNDGSPDNLEAIALEWTEKDPRFKYFKKKNGGLGSARNYGIEKAEGIYILPLDSDNKIRSSFTMMATAILDKDSSVGVVHGDAMYFGERKGKWKVEPFNFERILLGNYIDACAIYRKSLWEKVGGYDTQMPYQGYEDWELWLAFGAKNVKFSHLDEITFDYRVTSNSMIRTFSTEMYGATWTYIRQKYNRQYFFYFKKNNKVLSGYNKAPLKTSLTFFKKWIKSCF